MGTFDVNQSARTYASNAQRHAASAHRNMQNHNRQYQDRMRGLGASGSHRRSARPSGFPGDEDYQERGRGGGLGRFARPALITALVLGVGGVVIARQDSESVEPVVSTAIEGTVLEGTAWNVRGGPGTEFPPIAVVEPGQAVRVTCLELGWARLESPNQGAYVYSEGLALKATPPPC